MTDWSRTSIRWAVGLELHGGRVDVDTSNYESSRPGIFAVGDIANYPNKRS